MKDSLRRIIIGVLSGVFLGYVVFLLVHSVVIVQGEYMSANMFVYGVLLAVGLYMLIVYAIRPVYFKMTKATIFVIGIALLFLGEYVLLNRPSTNVFIGDIVKIIGVVLAILAFTNVLINKKLKQKKQDEKMEVIEV